MPINCHVERSRNISHYLVSVIRLYFGDNLAWIQNVKEFSDVSVDLVCLDPPFSSNTDYKVLFRETNGRVSPAQFNAFADTWSWADAAETDHQFVDTCQNVAVFEALETLIAANSCRPKNTHTAIHRS